MSSPPSILFNSPHIPFKVGSCWLEVATEDPDFKMLSKGGECLMPESNEFVPLLQAVLRLEPMSLNSSIFSVFDKRLAKVIPLVLKFAKPFPVQSL